MNEDGWIEWTGDENPVPGKLVMYVLLDGYSHPEPRLSDDLAWDRGLGAYDIVSYRVVDDPIKDNPPCV